jgi:C-terminal processing protease CtpA/Prc
MIDGKLVVKKLLNDSLAALTRMKPGDVIIAVNGEKVQDKMKRMLEYVCASNEIARVGFFSVHCLFTGSDSNFIVTRIRKGLTFTDTFTMPPPSMSDRDGGHALPWRMLEGNIGYVDMGGLRPSQVDPMMDALAGAKGIIFDVRQSPMDSMQPLYARLSSHPFEMVRMTYQDLDYPGVFRWRKARLYGGVNQHPYKGKVVLLADGSCVSHSEYVLMGLQAATRTTTIGNTTAGQDGDISQRIWLPGGLFSRFSSLGIYYPDGTCAQRAGVRIDKIVIPTIRGLQEGRDEVLEAGINFIKGKP